MQLETVRRIYFVGIGGIGMSALARYFHKRGIRIDGYDRTATPLTKKLEEEGMQIHYETAVERIPQDLDLVIYTPAVPADHPELAFLRSLDIPMLKRAAALGWISQNSKTIAIAGTHGKTTTSSMTTWLWKHAGWEPSGFLGGIAGNFESNYVPGQSEWVIAEADEYDRSFLHLHPHSAAPLSADPDHLEIYGSHEAMLQEGFKAFAGQVQTNLVVRHDLLHHFQGLSARCFSFGQEQGDFQATQIRVESGAFVFDLISPRGINGGIRLPMPGRHNVLNATAAAALAELAGIPAEKIRSGLESFKGIQRRFERIVDKPEVVYIDDYAHHPAELTAAIQAARALFPDRKIRGIFQPHLYSRTRDFMDGFAAALDLLDEAWLLPIYPARELPIDGIDSGEILKRMELKHKILIEKSAVLDVLRSDAPEVLLTLGAGDIDQLVKPIKELLNQQK
ncbi:MAG: UDP-N-acetylmuramate--L-alanine ligase [Phaeodactylibacter sp.]|nr:UDP-N-acetylmuramate--L-alanine ligase [Phaeodactylibacter sp.]